MKFLKNDPFLVVLLFILGFLFLLAATVPSATCSPDLSKGYLTCRGMSVRARTLDLFKLDNGVYPSTKEGFEALLSNPDVLKYPNYPRTSYYKKFPKDAWGAKIVYVKIEDGFELISYGADKKEGGDDEDADIFYSECGKFKN